MEDPTKTKNLHRRGNTHTGTGTQFLKSKEDKNYMKLGYSKLSMERVPVPTAIRHIAELGYNGIELDVDSCVKNRMDCEIAEGS